jgi:hypothetical protein
LFVNTNFTGAVAGSPGTGPTNWNDVVSTGQIVSYDSTTGKLRLATSATRRGFSQAANMAINSVQTASVRVNVISGTLAVGRVLTVDSAIPAGASLQWQVNGVNVANSGVALPSGESLLSLRATTTTDPWTLNFEVGNGVGGTATGDVELWEPQFETGSARTNYQRVGLTAFDVTESGQRDCYGVWADGIDDWYQTASIDFSGTDKITVFAAVRLRASTAQETLIRDSSRFALFSRASVSVNRVRLTANAVNAQSDPLAQPQVAIITATADIAAPLAELRFNQLVAGAGVGSSTASQGAGNFEASALNLFSNSGGTAPANVDCFGLIWAGGRYSLSTIQRVERLLSRITPTVNL